MRRRLATHIDGKLEQFGHSIKRDLRIVFCDHANVMLANALLERLPALISVVGKRENLK